jgi:hypothetical protein
MRPAHALWLLGLSIALSGCALVEDASRNIHVACATPREERQEKARNQEWAEEAWQTVCKDAGASGHSPDFAQGFKDGFAEYLFRGGNGELPLAAPLRYRDVGYQNPQGYQAIQDWFEGYRLGSARAHDSGARKWITGPSPLHPESHESHVMPANEARAATLGAPEPERKAWLQPPMSVPGSADSGTPKPAPTAPSTPTVPAVPRTLEILPSQAPRGGSPKLLEVVPEPPTETQPIEPRPAANSGSLRIHAVELAPPDAR